MGQDKISTDFSFNGLCLQKQTKDETKPIIQKISHQRSKK